MGEGEAFDAFVLSGVPGLGQLFERQLPLGAVLVLGAVAAETGNAGLGGPHVYRLPRTVWRSCGK